ncbi:Outer membrane protein ImpK/VasF, OmpA/MotB [Candidatus Methylobacter favarea]|uniref:Outer membrane protein ImpK/VasF, OmpA/MotB n=1 Tax=Candidatus Methylobacter favarea TaxID=2707345 RepID=A0A8S0WHB9_9GAMM|nr:type IVB secretion system protein IcmH/DotU [Candidatus Methylobacter favarea]CAA9889689.1 Outer membrane protein ImpK/VasF, OmpA/MotB [Candidatus Methylobacter favarea]
MASDDPFFSPQSDDRTIIRPVPGGKRSDIQQQSPPSEVSHKAVTPYPRLGRLNPLEKAASGLLALLTRLNTSRSQSDPAGLKNKIIQEIQHFQINAQANDIDLQTVSSARYVMCTVLDEAVLNTPWGNNSGWSQQSLLSLFHKEVSGGERFFDLLKSLAQNPGKNRNLLELMYLCLALGFEGRYRLIEGGKNKLASIREWLFEILQQERGAVDQALSPHWQGVTDRRHPLTRLVPLWVFGATAAALLAIMFSFFLFQLNKNSDPVFREMSKIKPIGMEATKTEPLLPPESEIKPTLSMLLADEIELGKIKIIELTQGSTLTIQEDNLFKSGSPSINRSLIPLLYKIADSLNQLQGQILITGHSDNNPIRSTRYPSNWHLSKARANAIAFVIKQKLIDPERITVEGKSDLEPVATNDTPEGRAKNRRVEISLLK